MSDIAIKAVNVTKQYRLGAIGGGTLKGDLQSWMARVRGKDDPNLKIGEDTHGVKKNQRFLALDDVSFEVKKGDVVGIIGHNGAGKSTLLKLLSRVTAPTSGEIGINGRVASMLEVGTGFHGELTGRENVYMNGAILGMTKAEVSRKFDDIVEFAEMEKFIDTPVKRYSSGMYVKLAFSVAAHLDSEIMIMDEVLAVGDMKFQQKCLGRMGDASSQEGRTVLYVSHNMNTIRQLCKRCIVLDHGKIIYDGDVASAIDIYSNIYSKMEPYHVFKKDPSWEWYPRTVKMLDCRMTNTVDCKYNWGDKIEIEVNCYPEKDFDDIRICFEIFNSANMFIGAACSGKLHSFYKGENSSFKFAFDTSCLSNGKYYANIEIYKSDETGNKQPIDNGKRAVSFELIDTPTTDRIAIGDSKLGGCSRYPDLITDF